MPRPGWRDRGRARRAPIRGRRTGARRERGPEWEALAECFADDAALEFEGIPVGPFAGRDAIAAAYRDRPPDDELRILGAEEQGATVVARYSWSADPEAQAGRLRLTRSGDKIERVVVTSEKH